MNCSIEGCGRRPFARSYCRPHWNRWRSFGDPTAGSPLRPRTSPLADRFWEKVDQRGPADCWEWTAFRDSAGYGRIHLDGIPVLAHRIVFSLIGRDLDPALDVDHLCFNRACVNPAHLEPVTHAENMRRMVAAR